MNRYEFMRELEILLSDLSPQERADALSYYNDYFDDAGQSNEENVLKELKSPREVSDKIKDGLNEASKNQGSFTENGYTDSRYTHPDFMANTQNKTSNSPYPTPKKLSGWQIFFIILLALIAIPIFGPIAFGAISVIFGIVLTIICIVLTITILAFALLILGVVVFVVGIVTMFSVPFAGVLTSGVGLIVFALGILLGLFTIWIYAKAVPACIRGFVALCRLPFKNRRKMA